MALILIVDDALLSRSMVKKILKSQGHITIEAKDGEEALRQIKEKQPDFVCLDMLLPKINGIEVLQKLYDEKSSIPVVMITADTQETTRQKCLELGAISVLNKPVKAEQLNQLIISAIK
ncbi:response regulator [Geminocystis sp. GBBB08]|uniref:response regulator transcription factor n=1 Tax=Geminocystis sp. GBBB08 TaxID=2604140 RepID=UPI0027E3157B|nr:response regulator [Geminocystis sp. GBBB08]MBL1210956.1 response regulator [Geminocystis sp. GBBB08]